MAAAVVWEPGPHGALTAMHASPLSTGEYAVPTSQAAHWRSAASEPAADWPWPAGQVAHGVHESVAVVFVLVPSLKWPEAHAVHMRSLLAVAAVVVWKPGPHGALTATHTSPLSTGEYVVPTSQAAHWRSAVAVPAADWPWPAGHVAHGVHTSVAVVFALVWSLKWPEAHGAHSRSLLAVAAAMV